MLKLFSTICLLVCFLSACVTQPYQDSSLANDIEIINKRVIKLHEDLPKDLAQHCTDIVLDINEKEAKRLKVQQESHIKQLRKAQRESQIAQACKDQKKENLASVNGKLLLGAVEAVTLIKEERVLDARIDTGAVTSSIGVFNWKNFERDGEKWVKFSLQDDADALVYQYPVHGIVKIKQTESQIEERIEIKIDIEVGGQEYKNQLFNIADRSHLNYQLLIGRSFLRDIAVVDVASKNLLGKL